MNTSLSLSFRDVSFDTVDRFGQPWLQANQVGQALGYSRPDAINTIYQSNADEFTDAMTALVKLHHGIDGAGQAREVRIFSLRGCHLLGMFARTVLAKEFRKWILDVLDQQAGSAKPQSADPAALAQQLADALQGKVIVDYEALCRLARMTRAGLQKIAEGEKLLEEAEQVGLDLERQCGKPLIKFDIPANRLARRRATLPESCPKRPASLPDPWEPQVRAYVAGLPEVTSTSVLTHLGVPTAEQTQVPKNRIAKILIKQGFTSYRAKRSGRTTRIWQRHHHA